MSITHFGQTTLVRSNTLQRGRVARIEDADQPPPQTDLVAAGRVGLNLGLDDDRREMYEDSEHGDDDQEETN